jgi:hypothetical protein
VRKGEALTAADLGLGYPARREEIRRFGSFSRRVTRVEAKQTDGAPLLRLRPWMLGEVEAR